jgi:hypothetical protein
MNLLRYVTARIASGVTTSQEINLSGDVLVGIFTPSALTGSVSVTAKNPISESYLAVTGITITANAYVPVDPDVSLGVGTIQLLSGSAEAATRDFVVALRQS